mgnify:CR=1 FL=1
MTLADGREVVHRDQVRIVNSDGNTLTGWFLFMAFVTNEKTGDSWVDVVGPISHKGFGKGNEWRSVRPEQVTDKRKAPTRQSTTA